MVVFFVLAGASLELSALQDLGLVGGVYIACRSIGKYLGAYIGGQLSHAEKSTQNWIGLALFPQAGVPIGMALVASHQFPEYRQMLLTIVISSTVFFEIVGPICTRIALEKAQS
jgi:Kef-type K+ transport system membrane component KefB